MLSNKTKAWQKLIAHAKEMHDAKIVDLFNTNPQRFEQFSLRFQDILFDYSKQLIKQDTLNLLLDLAYETNLPQAIQDLFNGAQVNKTEQRAALHTELRNPNTKNAAIHASWQQMDAFVSQMHASTFTDIIVLGIGGSDLGPRLVCEALAPYKIGPQKIHFIANVDSDTLVPLLASLNPKHTICLINSKTFTTIETLSNMQIVQAWMGKLAAQNCYAITANNAKAAEFGILPDHIFMFWDWVGGRYSVWSAVGLPIGLDIGMQNFKKFLQGAHAMDQHFLNAPLAENLPVLLALIGVWHINFQNYATLSIQPYADGLQLLPAYLQQLEMESNGKSVNNHGETIPYQTAPVIWGGVGCNGQHAYMQLLHQGTQVIPVDFLVAKRSHQKNDQLQTLLVASCLGQSQALMTGKEASESYKQCPGNRPSNTIMFECLTPELLGKIIALYEHKVYVQGVLWQIQSFDQWGVQLGKDLIKDILKVVQTANLEALDSSTAGLLQNFLTVDH